MLKFLIIPKVFGNKYLVLINYNPKHVYLLHSIPKCIEIAGINHCFQRFYVLTLFYH